MKVMIRTEIPLTMEQRESISYLFNLDNHEGEPWYPDEPMTLEMNDKGEICINECWLHKDGNWATYSEESGGNGA